MSMDLVLWRHAQAEDAGLGSDDLARTLTRRGEKQADRMAIWLNRLLPQDTIILCSPARRCQQTASALGRPFKVLARLGPGAATQEVLNAAKWPRESGTVLVVGHEPTLGDTVAALLQLPRESCVVRKGAVWWLRSREREGRPQTLLVSAQSPDSV